MSSAYDICCTYSNALQFLFTMEACKHYKLYQTALNFEAV